MQTSITGSALGLALLLTSAPAAAQDADAQEADAPSGSQADEAMQNGGMTEETEMADEQARQHFRAGRSLYNLGRFQQAALEFEEAYRLSQRPELLFNAYVAYRDANNLEGAVRNLGAYLDLVPDAQDRVNLEARLASMSDALQQQRARAAELERERSERERLTEEPPPPPPGPTVWPWVVMGVGSAMVVAGIVTGIAALSEADSLSGECVDNRCPPSIDLDSRRGTIEALSITTDVLLFGGAAVAALGLVLGLVLDEDEAPDVTAACGPAGCAATLRTRF